ncbi:MAG: hypothetical protein Lm2023SU_24520 [Serratia ureilytica]
MVGPARARLLPFASHLRLRLGEALHRIQRDLQRQCPDLAQFADDVVRRVQPAKLEITFAAHQSQIQRQPGQHRVNLDLARVLPGRSLPYRLGFVLPGYRERRRGKLRQSRLPEGRMEPAGRLHLLQPFRLRRAKQWQPLAHRQAAQLRQRFPRRQLALGGEPAPDPHRPFRRGDIPARIVDAEQRTGRRIAGVMQHFQASNAQRPVGQQDFQRAIARRMVE